MILYYFVEFAGSFANIALLLLFIGRLFPKKGARFKMVLCVCCAYDRWPVCTKLIPGLGNAAHDLSFSWRIFPRTAVLRSATKAGGFCKRSFLYADCFGGSACNAPDRAAHP